MENLVKILGGILVVLLILCIVFGFSYLVMYLIILSIFWAFGPVIFGYTFSYKIVIGVWLVIFLFNQFLKRSK